MGLRKLFKERSDKSVPDEDGKLKKSVRLEESLQEIQGRYRKLLNHTQAIQYTHDLQGQFLSVDQEITVFLGYDRNSLLNMNIRTILASEVRPKFETYLDEIKRQGVAKGLMVVQTASGEKRILKYYNTLRTEAVTIPFVQGIAYDVTEQKQTKKALAQLSEQLSIILKSLPIVCYISQAEEDYGLTYITHNVKAITGFDQTDFTSKSSFWANRIHPEDAPKIFADLLQIFEKGYHEHQYRWQVADGSYKWFYDYTRLIKSSDGKNYLIGMMQDITERKRAEEALLNAAQQWRTTFDGISDIVCLLDPEGKVLKCNKATTNLLGKPFSDILNRPYWEIIYGTAAPMKECPFLRMRENLCRETVILPIGYRWFNIAVDPLLNEAGSLIGAVYIMSDITERRRAAEALRAEKDRLQTVTENAPFGMVIIDKAGTFKYTNPKFRELLGYDLNDVPDGKTWFRKAYPDPTYRHQVISAWINDTALESSKPGERISRTFTITCKDGTEKIINFLPVKLEMDQYLVSFIDITVHKKAEEALRRSEEAATRLSQENAVMAEIGRVISSTLNIEEVYERFAEEVRKLISFDRIEIAMINRQDAIVTIAYIMGSGVPGRNVGDTFPMMGSVVEELFHTRSSRIIQSHNIEEFTIRFPRLTSSFQAGLRSMIFVPLISEGQVIGVLSLRTTRPDAYTEKDLRLAERVSNQIAGAIANAKLFAERKRAEEAAARLAEENAVMAEIGRVISSTLNIEEVYERFAEEVRKLISFDRIIINIINLKDNTTTVAYATGIDVENRRVGDIFSLVGSVTEECIRKQSSLLFQPESIEEGENRFPLFLTTLKAGLRSMIFVPLVSEDQVIGVLSLQSTKPNAYTESDLKLAERVSNQIAGAIANVQLFIERKRMEDSLRESEVKFKDLFDHAPLGYQEYDIEGRITNVNRTDLEMLGYTAEEMIGQPIWKFNVEGDALREQALAKLAGTLPPGRNLERTYRRKDGSMLPVLVEDRLILDEKGQIKGIRCAFQDITQRKRVEEALKRSEEGARRLSQENAVMAEIGRIISSTLNIEEVYERFAEEVRKLISFDRIGIQTVNPKDNTTTLDYTSGVDVEKRQSGDVISLEGTAVGECVRTRSSLFFQPENLDEVLKRFPALLPAFKAGLRSMMYVPLISKDEVIGVFHLRSLKPNAYTESDLKLAERVGNQIAGAIANAHLYTERKRAEESAARFSQENAIMAEIGRVISSTLNIDEVYEHFAEEVRKLILVERVSLCTINPDGLSATITYAWGPKVKNRNQGDVFSLQGTLVEMALTRRSGFLVLMENEEAVAQIHPTLLNTFRAGFRSLMSTPLISKDQVIGVLILHASKENAYTEMDLKLVERVGNEIAGAIANAQLYIERKRAEEAAARLAQENAIVAEIGRVISSTLNIEEVYERFAEEVRKLIPFDRIGIQLINPDCKTATIAYLSGIAVEHRHPGDIVSMEGLPTGECIRMRTGFIFQTLSLAEVEKSFPKLVATYRAGLRAGLVVPLVSKDEIIGVLHLRSLKVNAYTETDLKLAERVSNQVAGAIANAQLFTERKRAEEAAARLAQENSVMAEIGRIISSTLNIEEVYERFAEEVRKLIPFDRIGIQTVNTKDNTTTLNYISGIDVEKRRPGDTISLEGTAAGECVRARSGRLFRLENMDEVEKRYPGLLPTFKAGLRSILVVPLISKDEVIGVLHLRSLTPNAYTESDLKLAERVGNQIAGAIANAQLYIERKRAEEAAARLAQENAVMAEIGRVISSTLNIDEVYERFAEEVRKLIPIDRISLSSNNPDGRSATMTYVWGREIKNRKRGDMFPLKGTMVEKVMARRSGVLILMENEEALAQIYPTLLSTFQAGFRSIISAPLVSEDQAIGALNFHSFKEKAFTDLDVKLAERVGNQIAGAIANAQLFTERKHAEEAAARLAQENAVMAEIGQVIGSTLNIDEVYERFAEEVRKLIPFDRIAVTTINLKDHSGSVAYAWGVEIPHRKRDEVFPIKGLFYEELITTRAGILVQAEDERELAERYPGFRGIIHAGFRSMISVPLISKDEVIGVLHIRSLKPEAYTESDLRLAERVGSQIAGAIANAQLYTEQKQMEDALRKGEERFKELYDHAPLGYHEYDAKGIITNVNRTDLEMLGYSSEEMIGQPMWKFNVGEDSVHEQILTKLAGTSLPGRNLERIYRKKDGTTIPVLVEDRLILDEQGQIKGIRCTIQDITERKRAEEEKASLQEQLRQSQKMEAVGKLAGGVAHDFNNLLTVIHGYSELLLNSLEQGSRFCQDVQEIINASDRASSLTRQLLAFSRKQVLQPQVLDLNADVSNMDKMLRRMIGEDIELVTLLAKDLGRVKVDPGQIEQVILNLAVNAKDAMRSGGKLTIETANVKLDENYARTRISVTPGNYVMLSMSDTGVGMTPETKERIFEPFFTTKEKGKGTGLGLSTVYGIIQQSGGNIWVYSEPGLGTTFKIYLPTMEGETESIRPAAVSTKPMQGFETILLVEDEEMVRKLACTVLQKNGYRVLEASNGDNALDVVKGRNGNPIHLVVTDVVMPGMSGRQLADRLVSLQPELKVLYMSGYTDNAIVHHGVLDPGIAYIQKPFTPDALASKVRKILDGN